MASCSCTTTPLQEAPCVVLLLRGCYRRGRGSRSKPGCTFPGRPDGARGQLRPVGAVDCAHSAAVDRVSRLRFGDRQRGRRLAGRGRRRGRRVRCGDVPSRHRLRQRRRTGGPGTAVRGTGRAAERARDAAWAALEQAVIGKTTFVLLHSSRCSDLRRCRQHSSALVGRFCRHKNELGSPFNRSKSAADTTEPAGQAGSRPRHADSRGRALTCAAPVNLDDSGCRRGPLLIVLCRFSALVAGWRVAVLPDVLGTAPAPTAPGGLLSGVAGDKVAGQAGAGRAHSRCQQARNASFPVIYGLS
jgi:hypothetical protein